MIMRVFVVFICSMLVASCAGRFEPAPVVSLSTRLASENNLTEITGNTYIVQPGDTLFAIAFYSGNTYRELAKINGLSAPYTINVGQTLKLTATEPPPHTRPNIDLAQTNTPKSDIRVDPLPAQAYGEGEKEKHRNNHKAHNKSSINSVKRRWVWPASGEHTIATVGSDGTNRGLDIKGLLGSKITAAADGRVVYAGNALKGYGNLIIIKHDDEYLSAYAHNDSILVSEQTYVKQGQQIATMGQSGASEVMLHFEIRKKGKSQDPFIYLPDI
ncbi:peptidoglycan DD-metalloendopeptidase family protein [Glaciecola sp. XM2]|nr:peptidoglycan DD-metalloendopeptidase family protein [Glaciecola sp. XM2]